MGKVTQEQVAGAEAPSALRAGLQGPSLPPNQQPRLPPNQGLTGGVCKASRRPGSHQARLWSHALNFLPAGWLPGASLPVTPLPRLPRPPRPPQRGRPCRQGLKSQVSSRSGPSVLREGACSLGALNASFPPPPPSGGPQKPHPRLLPLQGAEELMPEAGAGREARAGASPAGAHLLGVGASPAGANGRAGATGGQALEAQLRFGVGPRPSFQPTYSASGFSGYGVP